MTEISFAQTSPRGRATINTDHVRVDLAAKVWINGVPASDEQLEALHGHFGLTWRDALAAMKALVD